MSKALENKTNLEMFISKALKKHESREENFDIEVKDYGLINFKRPSSNQLLKYLDEVSNCVGTGENARVDLIGITEASKDLVYNCCLFLQSSELREKLGIKDPLETPIIIFGIEETNRLAAEISDKAEGSKISVEVSEEIKN